MFMFPHFSLIILALSHFLQSLIELHLNNILKSQEIYRPGTALSHASNPCTAVGGDQNKEFRGNASCLREKGPRGGIKIYSYFLYFLYWPESQKSYVFALT